MKGSKKRSGFVSLVGRTNVGKSTLINTLIEHKVSITSRKPQTTRFRVLGIKTKENSQAIIIDTPGYHQGHNRVLNKFMNKVAIDTLVGIDVLVFVVEALRWKQEDKALLNKIPKELDNVILVINKIDKVKNKDELLPFIDKLRKLYEFSNIVPISALRKKNISQLERSILSALPKSEFLYPEDQITDISERLLISEIIREKSISRVGQEIPYRTSVDIDHYKEEDSIIIINATIYVEKKSQKGIVIGQGGKRLKSIGTSARIELEKRFDKKVLIKLWVKVKKNWTDNELFMKSLGYKIE